MTLASLKFKIQNSKFKKRKGYKPLNFIYGICKKIFFRAESAARKKGVLVSSPQLRYGDLILNL